MGIVTVKIMMHDDLAVKCTVAAVLSSACRSIVTPSLSRAPLDHWYLARRTGMVAIAAQPVVLVHLPPFPMADLQTRGDIHLISGLVAGAPGLSRNHSCMFYVSMFFIELHHQ